MITKDYAVRNVMRGDPFLPTVQRDDSGVFDWGTIFRVGTSALFNVLARRGETPTPYGTLPAPTTLPMPYPQLPGLPEIPQFPLPSFRFKRVKGAGKKGKTGQKIRRMNPCNHRALSRSIRRLSMFRHMAASVERHLPHHTAHRRPAKSCPKR